MSADEFADLVVRTRRTKVATDPSFARRHRSVRIYTDDEGMLCLNARLSPADGAIIRPLLSRAARDAGVTAVTDEEDLDAAPPGERMVADALMHVMLSYGSGTSSNPVQPVFLIDATKKIARTPDGVLLHPTAAERLLCDAVLMRVSSRAGGKLEAGRATRTVTRAMRRVIGTRDGGVCRFPGCHNRRHLQPHHIRHWARDKGPTDVDNLILLCTHHHKLVHEGGFQLWVGSDGRILAKSPTGRLMIRDGPLAKVG